MKIMILVQNYPPEQGPVTYSKDIAAALNRSGHEVVVVTAVPHYPAGVLYPGYTNKKITKNDEEGVRVVRLPVVLASNKQPIKRIIGFISFTFGSLIYCLFTNKPDLFILSIPPLPSIITAFLIKLIRRVPLIINIRDYEPVISVQLRFPENRFLLKTAYFVSSVYKAADFIVMTHPGQAAHLKKADIRKPNAVITHSVNLVEFDRLSEKFNHKYFERDEDKLYVLYAGTMGKIHNLIQLVRNLVSSEIKSLPFEFIFFGEGEVEAECRKLAAESGSLNIKFYNMIAQECVPALLKQPDILLISSDLPDTLGLKTYKCFAAGKPMLFHGSGPLEELLNTTGSGWTSKTGSREMLVQTLNTILQNKEHLDAMGLRGRMYAEEYFNFEKFASRWNEVTGSFNKLWTGREIR